MSSRYPTSAHYDPVGHPKNRYFLMKPMIRNFLMLACLLSVSAFVGVTWSETPVGSNRVGSKLLTRKDYQRSVLLYEAHEREMATANATELTTNALYDFYIPLIDPTECTADALYDQNLWSWVTGVPMVFFFYCSAIFGSYLFGCQTSDASVLMETLASDGELFDRVNGHWAIRGENRKLKSTNYGYAFVDTKDGRNFIEISGRKMATGITLLSVLLMVGSAMTSAFAFRIGNEDLANCHGRDETATAWFIISFIGIFVSAIVMTFYAIILNTNWARTITFSNSSSDADDSI